VKTPFWVKGLIDLTTTQRTYYRKVITSLMDQEGLGVLEQQKDFVEEMYNWLDIRVFTLDPDADVYDVDQGLKNLPAL